MIALRIPSLLLAGSLLVAGCADKKKGEGQAAQVETAIGPLDLPAPYASKSAVKFSKVIGWANGQMPTAPDGFVVTEYARDLINPRWVYVAQNGDVFVSESNTEKKGVKKAVADVNGQADSQRFDESANRVTLLRDTNGDGKPDQRSVFLTGLNQPFGMLVMGDFFYVANTDALLRFPYKAGTTKLTSKPDTILKLPAGGYNNHWTRNLLAGPDGKKIYISVGSGSNVGENGMENEVRRANILEINPDGSGERIYASGLRNPVGIDWQPGTNKLYAAVNERDELGDGLVPDYLTSVQEGGFYGWPYSYYGQIEDPRRAGEKPDLVKKAIMPDVPLGAHTASLGLAFYDGKSFPNKYQNGAFIGQHGSWNRSELSGYKVVFVPFTNGKPGKPEDFLTGFIAPNEGQDVHGRPVGTFTLPDGSLLVTDDSGNRIWRVAAKEKTAVASRN
ncbi:PQQ-dependent sugar dehydrogenase [Fibrivirga algicola]|uniref:Sorbosone dehydrogenase family protein n=1 Tax=Fibrivirga algicola TaxID=2950420 RepID=A0ABX0QAB6_9BACT|nr:sorbosone dehydrogenase family protein [Fibrivirga algicola]ARK09174.1 L-sorbosone dehydrogenase [Fibrella sp. ES10-3-2-2]NID08712.1 sorbosone dehydrogenase family protein [Fibrivirga algicola]